MRNRLIFSHVRGGPLSSCSSHRFRIRFPSFGRVEEKAGFMGELHRVFAMFPGQGSQKVGMGRDAIESSEMAKEYFDIAESKLGFSLRDLCTAGPAEKLTMTAHAQPAILTVSSIYYRLAEDFLRPAVAAGHSLGEYSALVAAGAIRFEDAVLLVHKRGKFMQEAVPIGKGKMVAVLGKEVSEIEQALAQQTAGTAEIANINSPGQVVVSGDQEGVNAFVTELGAGKIVELPVSAPFHSSLMKQAEERLELELSSLPISTPTFPVMSNFSAEPLTNPEEIRRALVLQVCGRVRWVECIQNAVKQFDISLPVEVGEGSTLLGLLKRILPDKKGVALNSIAAIVQRREELS
jgi:[acyl-carrier-protein] S-malonyltransferase